MTRPFIYFIALAGVSLLMAPLFIDNVDRSPWSEESHYGRVVADANHLRRVLTDEVLLAEEEYERNKLESIKDILTASNNQCLGG